MALNIQKEMTEEELKFLEEEESIYIEQAAREASRAAIEDALSHGRSVTIVEDDCIVRKHPDGSTEKIEKLERGYVTAKKQVYQVRKA